MRGGHQEDFSMTDTPPERREAEAPRDSDVATSGAEASREQLAAENARLRARVAELEAAAGRRSDGDERGMAHPGGSVSYQHLLTLIDNAPNSIFVKDVNHRLIFVNKKFASDWQRSPAELLGLSEVDLFPAAQAAEFLALEAQILASGEPVGREDRIVTPEGERWVHSNKFPIHDAEGSCLGISAFITDITDRRRAAAERLELKEQVIAAQQAALRELSTPLLPLTEGVLAMPLIGTIDSARAAEILETLLQGISARHVHTAILDITGVREVDAQTANALVGAARAARLLGARVILTGISPAVARMLVTLDANLGDIAILATLASGIAHALSR
jgi:PAS domain S-box-containing protein